MPRYIRPANLAEAAAALASRQAVVLAGGTELYRVAFPPAGATVIDLARLDELRQIVCGEAGLCLGALARWSDLLEAELPDWAAPLREAAEAISTPQIRHAGTLGGNLASRTGEGDGAVALLVLQARARVCGPAGFGELPLAQFLTRPPDDVALLTHIMVPPPGPHTRAGFRKLGLRKALGPPIGAVAASLRRDRAGAVERACAAVAAPGLRPMRLMVLEERLHGLPPGSDPSPLVDAAIAALPGPRDDEACSAGYRRHALAALLRRLLAELDGAP